MDQKVLMSTPRNVVTVERATTLSVPGFNDLVAESVAPGFALLRRLADEWTAGANRFDAPGEALFVATDGGRLVGVCGLNADPYSRDPNVGRLRHLYVARDDRRRGIGRTLVGNVVAAAADAFSTLTLRTNTPDAAAFYVAIGFTPTTDWPNTTHILDLGSPAARAV